MRCEVFRACLNTYGGFESCIWAFLPFGGICMQYDDYKYTNIKIQIMQIRYKSLGLYTQKFWAVYLEVFSLIRDL